MRKPKRNHAIQSHVDRWADLMKRIVKNPKIAEQIPNHANILFGDGDIVFINGEPQRYSELVKPRRAKHRGIAAKRQVA